MLDNQRIIVPNVSQDPYIGSTLNSLFALFNQIEDVDEYSIILDFQQVNHLHPFFLAPLAIYLDRGISGKNIQTENINSIVNSYFNVACIQKPLLIDSVDVFAQLNKYKAKSYIPLCKFPHGVLGDKFQGEIQKVIEYQSSAKGLTSTFSYIISELIDNIAHSREKYGYLFSQYDKDAEMINICIVDCGISVYRSYFDAGLCQLHNITDDATALQAAMKGVSSKDRDPSNRGFGVHTSCNIVKELGGEFLLLSCSAYIRNGQVYAIPEKYRVSWQGVMILIRVPRNKPEGFNYINYIQ